MIPGVTRKASGPEACPRCDGWGCFFTDVDGRNLVGCPDCNGTGRRAGPTVEELSARIKAFLTRVPPGVCQWAYKAPPPANGAAKEANDVDPKEGAPRGNIKVTIDGKEVGEVVDGRLVFHGATSGPSRPGALVVPPEALPAAAAAAQGPPAWMNRAQGRRWLALERKRATEQRVAARGRR